MIKRFIAITLLFSVCYATAFGAEARLTQTQTTLNAGEISPLAMGRFDIAKFANAVKIMENFLPMQLGGARFRPGTKYIADTKTSSSLSHLIPFQFSTEQAYILELGSRYMRFFSNQGQITFSPVDPADSATKILAHFNGNLTDSSASARTITAVGDASTSTTEKKFGSASLYLDGTNDSVTAADSADFDFSGGVWSVDMWVYPTATAAGAVYSQATDANNYMTLFIGSSDVIRISVVSGGVGVVTVTTTASVALNQWSHIAMVENGNSFYIFINGVLVKSDTDTDRPANYTGVVTIGEGYAANDFTGYIDEVRVSKASARWTAAFTPWTLEYDTIPAWATLTAYAVDDLVIQSSTVYRCLVAHTSGVFATDLAAGKWVADDSYEITTVYSAEDVNDIHYTQDSDTMYLFHGDYPPQKLQRVSSNEFTITEAPFVRGPFLDDNITATTITPSAATGTGITLTASSGIFQSGHIGSLWKVNTGVVKITAFTSATVVTGDVQAEPDGTAGTLTGTSAYTSWAEGAFSSVRGYPKSGTFYGQRLICGGTDYEPQKFYATVVKAYDNFKVNASDTSAAYIYEISSEQANAIRWIAPSPNALQFGTGGGTISASVTSGTITNANPPTINFDTNYGALSLQPKRISSLLYYVQRNGFNLRELNYDYLRQRNFAIDMNLLADHILRDGGGAYDIEYQQSPNDRVWVVRNDGQLAVLTRNIEQEVMGWSRIVPAPDSTSTGEFESVAVIQNDSADDEVWVICKRTINGTTKRFVELFAPENFEEDWDSINLDCSLTLDSPLAITGATKANPVVITAVSHGFSNGDQVRIDNVEGMTELNGNSYLVANKTADTFELTTVAGGTNVNGTSYGTYDSGGEARKMVTSITGLSHLNGETVSVQADGEALSSTYTVSAGGITLANKAAVVHVGLKYEGTLQLLKAGDMNTQFKNRRFHLSSFRVNRSLGFKVGQDEDNLVEIAIGDAAGETDPNDGILYTGDLEGYFTSWWAKDAEILIKQEKPNPLSILAISLRSEVVEED